MPFQLSRLTPDNIRRPPDWRWQLAKIAADDAVRPGVPYYPNLADKEAQRAFRFLLAVRRARNLHDERMIIDRWPDIHWAWDMRNETATNTEQRGDTIRYELEARLLTKEPMAELAKRFSAKLDNIIAYERLFFAVRDQLHNPTYIVHNVLGPNLQAELSEQDYPLLWKAYAFFRGSRILDELVSTYSFDAASLATSDDVKAMWAKDQSDMLKRKGAIAARTCRVTDRNRFRIIELCLQLMEIEQDAPTVVDDHHVGIVNMVGELEFSVAPAVPADLPALEARAGDQLREKLTRLTGLLQDNSAAGILKELPPPQYPQPAADKAAMEAAEASQGS